MNSQEINIISTPEISEENEQSSSSNCEQLSAASNKASIYTDSNASDESCNNKQKIEDTVKTGDESDKSEIDEETSMETDSSNESDSSNDSDSGEYVEPLLPVKRRRLYPAFKMQIPSSDSDDNDFEINAVKKILETKDESESDETSENIKVYFPSNILFNDNLLQPSTSNNFRLITSNEISELFKVITKQQIENSRHINKNICDEESISGSLDKFYSVFYKYWKRGPVCNTKDDSYKIFHILQHFKAVISSMTKNTYIAFIDKDLVDNKVVITDETVITDEPVIKEEPVIKDEPVINDEPVIDDEPVINDEPIIKVEPVIKDEPVITDKPLLQHVPFIDGDLYTDFKQESCIKDDPDNHLPIMEGMTNKQFLEQLFCPATTDKNTSDSELSSRTSELSYPSDLQDS